MPGAAALPRIACGDLNITLSWLKYILVPCHKPLKPCSTLQQDAEFEGARTWGMHRGPIHAGTWSYMYDHVEVRSGLLMGSPVLGVMRLRQTIYITGHPQASYSLWGGRMINHSGAHLYLIGFRSFFNPNAKPVAHHLPRRKARRDLCWCSDDLWCTAVYL